MLIVWVSGPIKIGFLRRKNVYTKSMIAQMTDHVRGEKQIAMDRRSQPFLSSALFHTPQDKHTEPAVSFFLDREP